MPAKKKATTKGKGKRGAAKGKGKGKAARVTKASRAGLTFNVGRVQRQMKQGKYAQRISPLAAVVLAATIEVCHYHHISPSASISFSFLIHIHHIQSMHDT